MKKFIYLILSVINTGLTALYLLFLNDDIVPLHFNAFGKADQYGSKWTFLLISGVVLFIISITYIIYNLFKGSDVSKLKNKKYFDRTYACIFTFFVVLFWSIILFSTNGSHDMTFELFAPLILISTGVIIILIGNSFGKIKPNRTFGLKTRATLKSETVWKKTHRIGGYTSVASGIFWIVCGLLCIFIKSLTSVIFIICLAVMIIFMIIIPFIYSEVLYSKEKHT